MSTFEQMADTIVTDLAAFVRQQEAITVLSQPIDATTLVLPVDDTAALSKGMIDVDGEIMYLKSVVRQSGVAQILPGTRGWKGTQARSHDQYALVRNNPTFPRFMAERAINDTLKGIDLYGLSDYEFMFDGVTYAIPLPAGVREVTGVTYELLNSTKVWPRLRQYRLDRNYKHPTTGETVSALVLNEGPTPGRHVRVQMAMYPQTLSHGDDFSLTGLPASCEDVIRLGAMWRMISVIDVGKVNATAPSADILDTPVAVGKSTDVAKYLYQLFSVRFAEEKAKQEEKLQTTIQYQYL